ncbi:unnamed protein product, partial [Vitis vinifera]
MIELDGIPSIVKGQWLTIIRIVKRKINQNKTRKLACPITMIYQQQMQVFWERTTESKEREMKVYRQRKEAPRRKEMKVLSKRTRKGTEARRKILIGLYCSGWVKLASALIQ